MEATLIACFSTQTNAQMHKQIQQNICNIPESTTTIPENSASIPGNISDIPENITNIPKSTKIQATHNKYKQITKTKRKYNKYTKNERYKQIQKIQETQKYVTLECRPVLFSFPWNRPDRLPTATRQDRVRYHMFMV